jgi:hypothetical protein
MCPFFFAELAQVRLQGCAILIQDGAGYLLLLLIACNIQK